MTALRPDLPAPGAARRQGRALAPPPDPPLIRAERLAIHYGRECALGGVDLAIPQGRVTAIVGPSGCGKTSFLQALNRLTDLVPGCRVTGRLEFGGLDLLAPDLDTVGLRRRIGMIFQKPNPFPFSIRRNLELPLKEHGVRRRSELAERTERALRAVGLFDEVRDRLDRPAASLSGGQQQRLCLARALALEPEVLLLDEPCSALDPLASEVVEDLIRGLRGRYTIVLVTHNLAQARRLADCAALFWRLDGAGRLIEAGPAARFFTAPAHALTRAYLAGLRG